MIFPWNYFGGVNKSSNYKFEHRTSVSSSELIQGQTNLVCNISFQCSNFYHVEATPNISTWGHITYIV